MTDCVDGIIDYEQGSLTANQTLELFSDLIKTGLVWQLQGHYGRVATGLIKAGYLSRSGEILKHVEE